MRSDRPPSPETGQVIQFRPRQTGRRPSRPPRADSTPGPGPAPKWLYPPRKSPVEGLRKYQHSRDDDDYRHRMVVNAFGLVFCILLAFAGVWLANAIADMKQVQECVLAGRSGCVPLKLPPHAG